MTLPVPVARGVALAAVATVGVTGAAVALHGSATPAAPPVVAAAGRAALVVPVPAVPGAPVSGTAAGSPAVTGRVVPDAAVPDPAVPDPAVLDPAALRRAVARAQAAASDLAARRTVEERGATPPAAARPDRDERARAEEDRTAERARRAGRAADPAEDPAPTRGTAGCDLPTGELGAVKPHVRAAAEFLGCAFGAPEVLGVAGRSNASDHPGGRALDFVVDRATGDRLAACAVRNRAALGVSYVIWRRRIDTGDGFRLMADRGSPTANHFDHVHVSFDLGGGTGDPTGC